ncbi:hypothetical protein OROHE_024255 [Orobanche hederae]
MMANFLIVLLALCVVPSIVTARFMAHPLVVKGYVYCDTCRAGYETSASEFLAGAVVKLECRKRTDTSKLTYTKEAVTNSDGCYHIKVHHDHDDDICDVKLVKSSHSGCGIANAGRDRARVALTRNNGMVSDVRFANALGFLKDTPLASCSQILQQYQDQEAED